MYIFSCYLLFAINHQVTCPRQWLLLQLVSRNERCTELELQWRRGAIGEMNVCCSEPQCLGLFITLPKLTKTLLSDACTHLPPPLPKLVWTLGRQNVWVSTIEDLAEEVARKAEA